MDASKSMAKPVGPEGGDSRLDAAKQSLSDLVDGLPDAARVGLRLYGHRVSGTTRAEACRDTELVRPVGPLDRAALKAEISAYHAVGSTPIGRALRAAAAGLPTGAPGSIVLVSDGGDNCAPPDPCRVAEQLAAEGRDVHIESVGFQVTGRARRQLRCIADRGRGVYRDAADADELAVALRALAARATRTYRPTGTPVRGTPAITGAPEIGSGRYLDRIGADGERWYRIELREGERLAASAVVSRTCPFTKGIADLLATSLHIDLLNPGGDLPEARSAVANLFFGDESTESDGLLTAPIGPRDDPQFLPSRPGRYLLGVTLSDNGNGSLAKILDGIELPLQVQTNVTGGDRPARALPESDARPPASAAAARSGHGAVVLFLAVTGCLLLGVVLSLAVARLGRRTT